MSRKKDIVRVCILLSIIFTGFILTKPEKIVSGTSYHFRLKAVTNSGYRSTRPDMLFFLKQHCARIGIQVDTYTYDWPTFVNMLVPGSLYDFDIYYVAFTAGEGDPDWSNVYSETGALNTPGYNTSMDWDEELGTGINEWYLQHGIEIMPSDSEERIQHYWEWENYLMDKILPIQPTLIPKRISAYWSNLLGYNYVDGLQNSWGKMSWDGLHTGQNSINEIVISEEDWQNLNPAFGGDQKVAMINRILDPVYMYDADLNIYPHLATDIVLINDTHIRLHIREGVKWHVDPDGLFPNEYIDVDDFYFSFYAMKHISNSQDQYKMIEDMEKIDQYTLDLFIDADPTTPENEPYAPYSRYLNVYILPEHYLNQTQEVDGRTPDVTHSSWNRFTKEAFGTGLFELYSHVEGVQTTLKVVPDCWYLDPLVDKSDMDFVNRFGDFSGGLDTLRTRAITNKVAEFAEFELGKLDLISISGFLEKRDEYLENPDFDIQSSYGYNFAFYGYNMREERGPLGNRTACPGDPTMTVGLALRKAISYALDRHEINEVLFGGEYIITDYPIYEGMGKWCNPNIIRYNHNLDRARYYMKLAGYYDEIPERGLNPWEISGLVLVSLFVVGVIIIVYIRTGKKK